MKINVGKPKMEVEVVQQFGPPEDARAWLLHLFDKDEGDGPELEETSVPVVRMNQDLVCFGVIAHDDQDNLWVRQQWNPSDMGPEPPWVLCPHYQGYYSKEEAKEEVQSVTSKVDDVSDTTNDPGTSPNKCCVIWMGTTEAAMDVVTSHKGMITRIDFDDGGTTDFGEPPQPYKVYVSFRNPSDMRRFLTDWLDSYSP